MAKVWGPYPERGGFRVRFQHDGEPKPTSKFFADKAPALAFKREMEGASNVRRDIERPERAPAGIEAYDGSAAWWDRAHGIVAVAVLSAGRAGDSEDVDLWSKVARALSTLAGSQTSHRDLAEVEKQIAAIEEHDASLELAAKDGTRIDTAGADDGGEDAPVRSEPLH